MGFARSPPFGKGACLFSAHVLPLTQPDGAERGQLPGLKPRRAEVVAGRWAGWELGEQQAGGEWGSGQDRSCGFFLLPPSWRALWEFPSSQPSELKPGPSASFPGYWGLLPWIAPGGAQFLPQDGGLAVAHTQAQGSSLHPSLALQWEPHFGLGGCLPSRPQPALLCLEFLTGARLEECCGYCSLTVAPSYPPPFTSPPIGDCTELASVLLRYCLHC